MEVEVQPEAGSGARLFVYGTLRRGFQAHELLRRFHARLLGNGSVRGRLYDLGQYPGAAEIAGNGQCVYGEVYFLPHAVPAFRVLDKFEGFDPAKPESNQFERRETTVTLEGEHKVRAWIYWISCTQPAGRRIRTGNYALRRE